MNKFKAYAFGFLGLALAALVLWLWHKSEVSNAYANGQKYGANAAYARVEQKARDLAQRADDITQSIREKASAKSRDVDNLATAVRLQGAGAAACLVTATPTADRRVAADSSRSPAVAPVRDAERSDLIALPFQPTVTLAQNHDQCWIEVAAWRQQNAQLWDAWRKENEKLQEKLRR